MRQSNSTDADTRLYEHASLREPHAVTGWPLKPLTRLDREGARGCVADLATVGLLSRQAAFVVLACADLIDPQTFLAQLDITIPGAAGLGEALRTRSARDLIGAVFSVPGRAVPAGYLRALLRVSEGREGAPGRDAFDEPGTYRRLWQIFTTEPQSPKAAALRYCGRLCSSIIQAVDLIDPVLLHPEILKHLTTAERTAKANALLKLLRSSLSSATDQALTQALRASLGGGSALESFARRVIEQADVFPPPPLPSSVDVTPLTSAAALIAFGVEMGNCARSKIGEVLLGLSYLYRVEHTAKDGTLTVIAVDLAPLNNGQWMIREIKGVKNRRPDSSVLRAVVRRLHALGAISQGRPANDFTKALSSLLGVYRWDMMDLSDLEDDEPTEFEEAA